MTAMELVQKMLIDFEMKSGKPATEITLAAELYDSLERELKLKIPSDMAIDYIKIKGVLVKRRVLQ